MLLGINLSPAFVAAVLSLLGGFAVLLPHLQALLQHVHTSPAKKAGLTVALSILAGLVSWVVTDRNGIDLSDPVKIALWISGVYTASTNAYARLWRPLGTTEKLEQSINPGPADRPEPVAVPLDEDDDTRNYPEDGDEALLPNPDE